MTEHAGDLEYFSDIHSVFSVPWGEKPTEILVRNVRKTGAITLYRMLGDLRLIIDGDPEAIAALGMAIWIEAQAHTRGEVNG